MVEPARRPARLWTPAELGVHRVVSGGPMPAYVRRPHDEWLRAVLDPETIYNRLVVIRGDALTGTSRAAYEAVTDVLADWALEYPPSAAALAARLAAGIPARITPSAGGIPPWAGPPAPAGPCSSSRPRRATAPLATGWPATSTSTAAAS